MSSVWPLLPSTSKLHRLAWLSAGALLGLLMAVGLFALLPQTAQAAGVIFYVSPTGDDANACSNAAQPCRTLQRAINVAGADDIIRLAAGVYTSTSPSAEVASISFPLTLSGGWEAGFTAQTGGPSLIDGENQRRGLTIAADAPTRLEALTIQNGAANEGAGIRADANSPLTLVNVQLLTNTAVLTGGGLHALGSVSVSAGRLENNQCIDAYCAGGGLYTAGSLTVTSTQFISNTARSRGGGAFAVGSVWVNGSVFQQNSISYTIEFTDAINGFGAGLYGAQQMTLTGTHFLTNTGWYAGGAFAMLNASVTNALFENNLCLAPNCYGGGMNVHGSAVVTNTQFISNTAPGRGGGLDVFGDTTLTGGLFRDNRSDYGGGLYVDQNVVLSGTQFLSNTARFEGGGTFAGSGLNATNAVFRYNVGQGGGGAYCGQGITLVNSVFEYNAATRTNGGGLVCRTAAASRITTSIFGGNSAKLNGGGMYLIPDAGLLIERSRLIDNAAQDSEGGGLFIFGQNAGPNAVNLDNNFIAANTAPDGAAELGLGGDYTVTVTGRHNTFSAQSAGSGTAVRAGLEVTRHVLSLTNSIFDGYAVGVQTGAGAATVTLDGVLWSGVTTPTVAGASPITVTAAYTGSSQFVTPAAGDYHIQRVSDAFNRGVSTALTTDIDGERRVQGSLPDLGADENTYSAELVLTKRVTPALATPGTPITFTLTFTNTGPDVAVGTVVTDLISSQYLTATVFSAQGVAITPTAGVTYSWQISNMPVGATGIITLTGSIRNDVTSAAVFANTATLANADDGTSANNSASVNITVALPITGLTAVSNSPRQLGSATQFTATVATGSDVNFLWNFGDGASAAGATATHTYGARGNYTTIVTATNAVSTLTATVPVTVTDVPITGLQATSNSPRPFGTATSFTATVGAGTNVNYLWNFGDGIIGSGPNPPHIYTTVGFFTALVTATNSVNTLTATVPVTITEVPIGGLSAASSSPTPLGNATAFTATASGGTNINYVWNFGDGSFGSGIATSHTYAAVGSYTVELTATNSANTLTATLPVEVIHVPITGLTIVGNSSVRMNASETFTATVTSGTQVSYTWTINGVPVGVSNPLVYAFPTVGDFTLTVTATNVLGSVQQSRVVTVSEHRVYLPLIQR